MVGTMRDITSTTEFLNAIKEQNEKLKKIAWTQSHELRGPLTRVMGLISLVDQDGFRDITLKEFLSYLTSATNELDQVIKDIVEASADIDVYQPDVNDEHSQFME
jgi:light-regulated signal transduction histidine kinase (bacteriophytochrome)